MLHLLAAGGPAQEPDLWSVYMTPGTIHDLPGKYVGEYGIKMRLWI